ncbi:MAG: hypothetical protein LQ346_000860 [Caloplaca aetnensis]|nr:MAG: hypothetical protein LQ346_000860 [Caloplaca aetnensis]
MYRLADGSTAPAKAPTVTPATPKSSRHQPATFHIATANANANANADPNMNEDLTLGGPMDTTWPWLEPSDWNDMQFDGSEQDLSQWNSNSLVTADSQLDASTAFLNAFPSLQGWPSVGNGDGDSSVQGDGHGFGSEHPDSSSSNSSSANPDKNGPDVGIARLSQLSTRLYPLHRSSCTLAETAGFSGQSRDRNQIHQSPLLDDTAFKSVAAFVHVSADMNLLFRTGRQKPALETTATGDTLHDAFSASRNLLEILRYLQADVATEISSSSSSTSLSTFVGGANLDARAGITSQASQTTSTSGGANSDFEQRQGSSAYARRSNNYSNTVIRHLVSACHTLLLNIYTAVLMVLQHDADRWSSSRPAGTADPEADADPAALADMGLVMAVQLSSYLIERLQQAVELYLSTQASPQSSLQRHELPASYQASPPGSTTANPELMSDLNIEVQQRLAKLRQTLRI